MHNKSKTFKRGNNSQGVNKKAEFTPLTASSLAPASKTGKAKPNPRQGAVGQAGIEGTVVAI
jgi:hypothetical protein